MNKHFQTHRPEVMGSDWMVTADHPLAARAGATVLESGGNAVDAAVAANLVLSVVRPHMCGFGGDLFALVYLDGPGQLRALNASGRAPGQAGIEAFQSRGLDRIPESGVLTGTVPGAVSGWQELLSNYGTMSLDRLLPEAIHYAENGFPVYEELRQAIAFRQPLLERQEAAAGIYCPKGRLPAAGELLVQPQLAKSYRVLAAEGPDGFYQGELGLALVKASREQGGLFSPEDLAGHRADWVEPLSTDYRGLQICTQPPNSQGLALLMQANLLEHFEAAGLGPDRAELIHLMVEAKKLSFADRDRYVCDPAFHDIPLGELLDKDLARRRAGGIDPGQAAENVSPGRFTKGGQDTVYLAVVDGQGNSVSLIQSIYEPFGSCFMVPETGMFLHNRGRGFSLDPDHPNRLEPGKRPFHTLHPAMVLRDGQPLIVLGSPGADGQTQTVIQLIAALIDFQARPQEAVEAPRWRSEADGSLLLEGRFPKAAIQTLSSLGHRVTVLDDYDGVMGSSQVIAIDRERGVLSAGADPRRQAYAIGR